METLNLKGMSLDEEAEAVISPTHCTCLTFADLDVPFKPLSRCLLKPLAAVELLMV